MAGIQPPNRKHSQRAPLDNIPSPLYNGYRVSFPAVKRPGRGVDHPPPSSARVKERVELYLYSPSGPSWPVLGRTLLSYLYITYLRMLEKDNSFETKPRGHKKIES
jgi:hypothetical protein